MKELSFRNKLICWVIITLNKGMPLTSGNRYTIPLINYIIHTFDFRRTGMSILIASYSYPLFMMVDIILKRSFALTIFDEWAGIIIDWPVVSKFDIPSITISALPSIT